MSRLDPWGEGSRSAGLFYPAVLLWLDSNWDSIRENPGLQALLTQYAKYKPATIHTAPDAQEQAGGQRGLLRLPATGLS